jgi:cytoskeletal protein CcmA (bactofilin family)
MIVVYSDSLEGSINNEHFVAKGKVKIEKNNLLANCRTCTYYGKKGLVIMEEEINLKTETFSLKGKKATYNLKTSSLRIEGSVSGHINLRGLKGSLSEDKDE